MCGIAGFVSLTGKPAEQARLEELRTGRMAPFGFDLELRELR